MRIRRTLVTALALVVALTGTALGHHGWSGYDSSKEMTLTGTIREAGYEHPHGYVALDVNAAAFHQWPFRSVHGWDVRAATPPWARTAAVISLLCWSGAITCGRLLAYF